jgi:hypothetical protein
MGIKGETCIGFLESSQEFLLSAELVLNKTHGVFLPAYFLLGRSIELSLKAFLLHRGLPIKELRKKKFGHNLVTLLNESLNNGIEKEIAINNVEKGVIELLSYDYADKRFEYRITGGQYCLPLIDVTCEIAKKLAFMDLNNLCYPD